MPYPLARRLRVPAALVALAALAGGTARADFIAYVNAVNGGGTPTTYFNTNPGAVPFTADIGAVSGDITYEFIVNGSSSASATLLGLFTGSGGQALKFEQFNNTGTYGATQYLVADYDFGVATTFGADVVVTFVADSGAGTTRLFVNGADTGATVPFAASLQGTVGIGGTYDTTTSSFFDVFVGSIKSAAVFDEALSATQIKAQADAYFAPAAVPEPASLVLMGVGVLSAAGLRRVRR